MDIFIIKDIETDKIKHVTKNQQEAKDYLDLTNFEGEQLYHVQVWEV